jgi:hypothetical protein
MTAYWGVDFFAAKKPKAIALETRIDEHAKPVPRVKPGHQSSQSAARRRCDRVHPFPLRLAVLSLGGRQLFCAVNKVDGTGKYSAYATRPYGR